MKLLPILLVFLFSINSHSQKHTTKKTYMKIGEYKKIHKTPLIRKDTLNFRYHKNDTMVLIENHIRPKGINVSYEYKDSTFLHYYKKVAFNHKSDSVNKNTKMKYWKDGIKIFFSSSVSKQTKKDLMSFAKSVASHIDSLSVSEVRKVENSNYIIYFSGDYEYESRLANRKTSDYLYWNKKNQIYKASKKLDPDRYFNEKLRLYEMKKYFITSLGYFKKIDDFSCESYFSNCYSKSKKITVLDIELLKYHYSYGICKGTDLETFEGLHKRSKETLKKHNIKVNFFHPYE